MLRTTLAAALTTTLVLPGMLSLEPPDTDTASVTAAPTDLAALVNPFIGTQKDGNTFPGASTPFGMVQLSPDTLNSSGGGHYAGYNWDHSQIRGFSMLHPSGVGCGLGGNLPIMPTTGDVSSTRSADYASSFSHDSEAADPGYYRVTLDDYGITAELTATTRTGTQRYTFPETDRANVLINTGQALHQITNSTVTVIDDRTIETVMTGQGFCQATEPYTVYTVTTFDRDIESVSTWSGDTLTKDSRQTSGSGNRGVAVTFDATQDRTVEVTTALSWVDLDGARRNMAEEGTSDFDDAREHTYDTWNDWLEKIAVTGGEDEQQRTFYSSLYRALLSPNTGSDVDGRYTGWDQQIHATEDFTYYQTWSLWDTYRTQQQLLSLIAPAQMSDMARSILKVNEHSGWLPRWGYATVETNVMTGDPVTPFLVSAYHQGLLQGFEEEAYAALKHNADVVPPADHPANGRVGNPHYLEHGYVPYNPSAPKKPGDFDLDHGGSATLEYALADAMLATMAESLGHTEDAERYAARGQNYRSIFDPRTDNFRARDTSGMFIGDPDPARSTGFHEGTASQYLWHVQQDIPGLIELLDGAETTEARLDHFFRYDDLMEDLEHTVRELWVNDPYGYYGTDVYNPQNEPNIHAPYVYLWTGQPWKTTDIVHGALTLYTDAPNGVTGNDDMGTMSSWHVLSSIGVYPAVPGAEYWALTSPVFESVLVDLDPSYYTSDLSITAPGTSANNRYIQGVTLNGDDLERSYLTGDDLRAGADVVFAVGDAPSTWATSPDSAPPAIDSADVALNDLAAAVSPTRTIAQSSDQETELALTVDVVAAAPGTVAGTIEVQTDAPLSAGPLADWSINSGNLPMTQTIDIPVTLAANAEPGEYPVAVTVRSGEREVVQTATIAIGAHSPLTAYFNNTGIGDRGTGNANLDLKGWYLLRDALADAGIVQGRTYEVPGNSALTYALPLVPPGEPDNIAANGEKLDLAGTLTGATTFSFVGTGASGNQSGQATVRLDDGSSFTTPLGFTDWCADAPALGNIAIVRTSERGAKTGTDGARCGLFATAPVAIPEGREVIGIDLPVNRDIHVFAIASDAPEPEEPGEPGDTVVDDVAAVTFDDE
ncbi:MAG: GH92 family glycosyl hydrolase, partial [Cellulomonadaceae bacterium]